MRRRLWFLLPLALLAVLVLSMSAGAAGSQTFTDPTGDATTAPDITTVVVANDDNGVLTFTVTLANPALLSGENLIFIALNSDKSTSTGSQGDGVDYLIVLGSGGQVLARWAGTTFEPVSGGTLARTGATAFTIGRADLGNTTAFDFYLFSLGPNMSSDDAPDGSAIWSYALNLRPELESASAGFRPAVPRAGKAFAVASVSLELGTGQNVRPTTYRCVARLAGKTLRSTGRCRWLIPKNARGKRLVVTIVATYGGVTGSFGPYAFRVRP